MKHPSDYWNPYLETLERERLRDLQLKKFKRIVTWAYDHSPFYRQVYREAGLEPGDVVVGLIRRAAHNYFGNKDTLINDQV